MRAAIDAKHGILTKEKNEDGTLLYSQLRSQVKKNKRAIEELGQDTATFRSAWDMTLGITFWRNTKG